MAKSALKFMKVPILALIMLTAFGPMGYIFARVECAGMMTNAAKHECCEKRACQCSLDVPSNNVSSPEKWTFERHEIAATLLEPSFSSGIVSKEVHVLAVSSEFPPGTSRFLSSVLRI